MEDHLLLIGEILYIFKLLFFHVSFPGLIPEFIHLYTPPKATCALNSGYFKGKVLLQTPFFRGHVSIFFLGGGIILFTYIQNIIYIYNMCACLHLSWEPNGYIYIFTHQHICPRHLNTSWECVLGCFCFFCVKTLSQVFGCLGGMCAYFFWQTKDNYIHSSFQRTSQLRGVFQLSGLMCYINDGKNPADKKAGDESHMFGGVPDPVISRVISPISSVTFC